MGGGGSGGGGAGGVSRAALTEAIGFTTSNPRVLNVSTRSGPTPAGMSSHGLFEAQGGRGYVVGQWSRSSRSGNVSVSSVDVHLSKDQADLNYRIRRERGR